MYKEMLGTRASIAIIIHSCSFFSFHVFPFHPCWVRFVRSGLWPCVWGVAGVCTPNTNTEVTLPFRSSRTNHFRAPEPTIPEVLAVFPTQRFHQPRSAAPPPTPTIATYKPFNSYLVSGHYKIASHLPFCAFSLMQPGWQWMRPRKLTIRILLFPFIQK